MEPKRDKCQNVKGEKANTNKDCRTINSNQILFLESEDFEGQIYAKFKPTQF